MCMCVHMLCVCVCTCCVYVCAYVTLTLGEEDVRALLSEEDIHGLAAVQLLDRLLHRFLLHVATHYLVVWCVRGWVEGRMRWVWKWEG